MRVWWIRKGGLLAVVLTVVLCGLPFLTANYIPAYRDAVHFYYPLYHWIAACWGRAELPLWNPQIGTGVPVVAETTTAVFYPGKLVFALPASYTLRFNLYIFMHILLAALGTYAVARQWRMHRATAAMAAVSYSLGGTVLFQYCNVVYLVGAAWLPAAVAAVDTIVSHGGSRAIISLAAILALMTLGGDPQMAYHVGLFALLYVWIARSAGDSIGPENRSSHIRRAHHVSHGVARFAVVCTVAVALCAVQWVPAVQWTGASRRVVHRYPRTIYELAASGWSGVHEPPSQASNNCSTAWKSMVVGLCGQPATGTHQRQIYDFSVSPSRIVECIWPNFSGRPFPENHRWLTAARLEDRVWTPSLYMGLLPFVLGILAIRLRGRSDREKWLSWIVVLSCLASLGWYGPGWLVNIMCPNLAAPTTPGSIGNPTGGLYWLMVTFLPDYVYFRYPAKLLICAAFGLSLLGGFEFDRLRDPARRRRLMRMLSITGGASLLAILVLLATRQWWSPWLRNAAADELYGPLDAAAAWRDAFNGCVHCSVVSISSYLLLSNWTRFSRSTLCYLLLGLTAGELVLANRWMLLVTRVDAMRSTSVVFAIDRKRDLDDSSPACVTSSVDEISAEQRFGIGPTESPFRIYRRPDRQWVPSAWQRGRSEQRPHDTVHWDRVSLLPNIHLLEPLANVTPRWSIAPRAYHAVLETGQQQRPDRAVIDVLGVRYLLLPDAEQWPAAESMTLVDTPGVANVRFWRNPHAYPRAWIVHRAIFREPIDDTNSTALQKRVHDVFFTAAGNRRNLREVALLEARHGEPPIRPGTQEQRDAEHCTVVGSANNSLNLDVELKAPGLVVISDLYYPDWRAIAVDDMGRIEHPAVVRANQVMRAVALPAGRWRLNVQYCPRAWYVAAVISLLAWLTVMVSVLLGRYGSAILVSPSPRSRKHPRYRSTKRSTR